MKKAKKVAIPRYYSPSQAHRDMEAIDAMFETGDPKIMTVEVRDKLKRMVQQRLADSVSQ